MSERRNVALIVPSIRKDSFERFIREWSDTALFEIADLILVEDNPKQTFFIGTDFQDRGYSLTHLSWADIPHEMGWIIPRRSDTVRSYGYWYAWSKGYEYLMTLDDDCYPSASYPNLADGHLGMLNRTKWFNTLTAVTPRGIPYKNLGERRVYVNHGIWEGVLDYDAPHQLVDPAAELYSHDNRIVPSGAYFPMCGMNVMWRAEATILMYHLLMGRWKPDINLSDDADKDGLSLLPFDRFGDIWCGILMKKVADHLGWAVSSGTPYIHHDRASDTFKNLRKEASGIEVNEWFWQRVDEIHLTGSDPVDCYVQLAHGIRRFGGEHSMYWLRLSDAMQEWADLFKVRC